MKFKLIAFVAFIALISCGKKDNFTITGTALNVEGGKLLYAHIENNAPVFTDTIDVVNNKFSFTTKTLDNQDFRFLVPIANQRKFVRFFADNSDLTIAVDYNDVKNARISGSVQNDSITKLFKDYEKIELKSNELQNESIDAYQNGDEERAQELQEAVYKNEKRKSERFMSFAKNNKEMALAPWALNQIVKFKDYSELYPIYQSFAKEVKENKFGMDLKMVLDAMAPYAIGAKAPDFILNGMDGKAKDLKEYYGDKTLLQFWNPTCEHCRVENQELKELLPLFKKNNISIIGINIAYEFDEEIWKLVVEEDGMDFLQVYDDKNMADAYKVSGTPYLVLLDKEGKYLKRDISLDELKELINK